VPREPLLEENDRSASRGVKFGQHLLRSNLQDASGPTVFKSVDLAGSRIL
jgi:hypothetical protein